MFRIAILAGKLVTLLIRAFHLGAGATWPGEIALRLQPSILTQFSKQNKKIILIAGTNGKTTTAKMIETIFAAVGLRSARNISGANLDNGLISTFLADSLWNGPLVSDYFIFEVDEATLPIILKQITPHVIVLTNLFRDQLDRYGEVDTIAEKWQTALRSLPKSTTIIANADDPHLVLVGTNLEATVKYFGLEDPSLYLPKMQHATDTIYCPRCGTRLTFAGVYFSHLGKWTCGHCKLNHPDVQVSSRDFISPLEGVYNKYNAIAAALAAREAGVSDDEITNALKTFTPAFGRMETIDYQGKTIKILLSKNPTGFNESLRTVVSSKQKGPILVVLNDRIPDGTDVSWIWDVDFENLNQESGIRNYGKRKIFVSGDRCFDLGLRLKYADVLYKRIYRSLEEAIEEAVHETEKDQTLWILPTYSAMLDVRKIVTGKKIL